MSTVVTDNVQDSGGSSLLGRRNAIINGNFGVNQRGVSGTVSLSAGEYGHDRWKAGASGATYTFSTSGGVTTLDISAGSLIQVVEDVNIVTDTYVLSFEGTAQGKIGAGSFGDSGVTGAVTGGSNLNIEFNTGTVSKVQLEIGNKHTPFEHRSYGEELRNCARYYYKFNGRGGSNLSRLAMGFLRSSTNFRGLFQFPTEMRTTQTLDNNASVYHIEDSAGNSDLNATVTSISQGGPMLCLVNFSNTSLGDNNPATVGVSNTTDPVVGLGFDAEL